MIEKCSKRLPAVKSSKSFVHSGFSSLKRDDILVLRNNSISTLNLTRIKKNRVRRHNSSLIRSYKSNDTMHKESLKIINTSMNARTELKKNKSIAVLKPNCSKNTISQKKYRKRKISCQPLCRYKEFLKMPLYNQGIPCINIGSPYKTKEDISNEEYKRAKNKWITKNGFIAAIRNSKEKYINNYVTKDPSEPPVLHKFRSVNKSKWVSGSFKLI